MSSPTLDGLEELTRADSAADDSLHDVVHLSVPAVGESSPPDAPLASVFFFAGTAQEVGACGHTCVSVWWGADPSFEQALLLELQSSPSPTPLALALALATALISTSTSTSTSTPTLAAALTSALTLTLHPSPCTPHPEPRALGRRCCSTCARSTSSPRDPCRRSSNSSASPSRARRYCASWLGVGLGVGSGVGVGLALTPDP